jgi:hypothetical protein
MSVGDATKQLCLKLAVLRRYLKLCTQRILR